MKTPLFDSHCHLQDPAFDDDRPAVLERAREAGVEGAVVIASDPEDAVRARAVAEAPGPLRMAWTAGLHPHEARRWNDATGAAIAAALAAGAAAIGETGLDFHYLNSAADEQEGAFAAQLALAVERDRPVVVHSREAERDTLAALAASGIAPERVVLHCFTGSRGMLEEAVSRGYYVSFSGIVTFPRFPGAELAPLVPEERLLVESDAPYLAPVPHRGRRNEPAFVADTVRAVAAMRGVAPEDLAARTRDNALRFYGLARGGPGGTGSLA
jgi:TatD DNase family protein